MIGVPGDRCCRIIWVQDLIDKFLIGVHSNSITINGSFYFERASLNVQWSMLNIQFSIFSYASESLSIEN